MAKKCPPGVFCIENMTLAMIIIILAFLVFYVARETGVQSKKQEVQPTIINIKERNRIDDLVNRRDVLLNPYTPPYNNSYLQPVATNRNFVNQRYTQVGFLKSNTHKELMLPLFGRQLYTNRDKWQYYTLNENNIKLPVSNSGKSCTSEYGCNEIMDNDSIYVEGYNTTFKATVYENNTLQYIPYI